MTKDNPPGGQRFELCVEEEMAQDDNTDGLLKWQMSYKEKDHSQEVLGVVVYGHKESGPQV